MPRRIRTSVIANLANYPRLSATERMWREVIAHLRTYDDLAVTVTPGAVRRRWRRGADAVIYDGHQGHAPVGGKHLVHVQEASWDDPALKPFFEPWFLDQFTEPTREALRRADGVIVPSSSSAEQVVQFAGIDRGQITVTPHGVDLAVFRPDGERDPAPVLRAHGAADVRPYVLYVSTLHPRKNLSALRDAMTRLGAKGFPHSLLLVAASAADRDSSALQRAAVADLGAGCPPVTLVAGLDDAELATLMRGAAAFCLPSLMEGFGLTPLEAMACGAPVVTSDRGSLPEVVGDAGLVVTPTGEAIAEALATVLTDDALAASLRERGTERAQRFTWRRAVEGWHDAILSVV
jgi:glycosyltransferase involved in cell wall biosynthesis